MPACNDKKLIVSKKERKRFVTIGTKFINNLCANVFRPRFCDDASHMRRVTLTDAVQNPASPLGCCCCLNAWRHGHADRAPVHGSKRCKYKTEANAATIHEISYFFLTLYTFARVRLYIRINRLFLFSNNYAHARHFCEMRQVRSKRGMRAQLILSWGTAGRYWNNTRVENAQVTTSDNRWQVGKTCGGPSWTYPQLVKLWRSNLTDRLTEGRTDHCTGCGMAECTHGFSKSCTVFESVSVARQKRRYQAPASDASQNYECCHFEHVAVQMKARWWWQRSSYHSSSPGNCHVFFSFFVLRSNDDVLPTPLDNKPWYRFVSLHSPARAAVPAHRVRRFFELPCISVCLCASRSVGSEGKLCHGLLLEVMRGARSHFCVFQHGQARLADHSNLSSLPPHSFFRLFMKRACFFFLFY